MRIEVDGLVLEVPPQVYVPAEDSFLLVKHSAGLRGQVLDIGCGCGIQALVNAKRNPGNGVLGVDLNRRAVECSRYNAAKNGIKNASFAVSDLFENVPEKKFDAVIFNPPYLPTAKGEHVRGPLDSAFDGGEDGRRVIDRFLPEFEKHLACDGRLLMLQSSLNDIGKTVSGLEKRGLSVSIMEEQKLFFEKICVVEARRK
ncbi:methyltransferase [Candidatus Micrarchaeota archaeon]|nr:methyltransferase [Candidatus Micrarchaeota archaeon]